MGATIDSPDRRQQLDEKSLGKLNTQGIHIVDSGYTRLSNGTIRQYVLVLNRRNNYSIRQRTIDEQTPDPNFDVVQSFKDSTDRAMRAWKILKKDFEI